VPVPPADERAASARQQELLREELDLVKEQLASKKKMMEVGRASRDDVIAVEREILSLQRQLAALDRAPVDLLAIAPAASAEAKTESPAFLSDADDYVEQREIARLQTVIQNSPDLINGVDQKGFAPLHYAADKSQLSIAEFLLTSRAQVDVRSRSLEITPLGLAAGCGHKKMVALLPAAHANVNARTPAGVTPLHLASARGFRAVAELLLEHGADPNVLCRQTGFPRPSDSNLKLYAEAGTPLHGAVALGHLEVVELLLRRGGDG
jgi:ankyrin repeat protein